MKAYKRTRTSVFAYLSPWSHVVAIGSIFTFLLAACGDDSSNAISSVSDTSSTKDDVSSSTEDADSYATFDALPACAANSQGYRAFVEKEASSYICTENGWKNAGSEYDASANILKDFRDGQTYKTTVIGLQTWMAENLNFKTANSYCYNDSDTYCAKYGRLYSWAAAMDSTGAWSKNGKGCGYNKTCSPTYPVRGICPEGWHLPSQTEWETLFTTIDGSKTDYDYDHRSDLLKSTSGWIHNSNGTDDFAFNGLPAGYKTTREGYYGEGGDVSYWSSTELDITNAYYMTLCHDDCADIAIRGMRQDTNKVGEEYSIRCVKDGSVGQKPSSGETSVFGKELKDPRDGQTYKTVVIGKQTWMAENLNYKTENSFCYGDNEFICDKYGRLYTWAASMDSAGTWSANGKGCGYDADCSPTYPVQGVCPKGWHLPSQTEWETLLTTVGGESIAGKMLKSAIGWEWHDSSNNGTDAYSFTALPAGRYDYWAWTDGYGGGGIVFSTSDMGEITEFWGSTYEDKEYASYISLDGGDDAYLGSADRRAGYSIRCVEN